MPNWEYYSPHYDTHWAFSVAKKKSTPAKHWGFDRERDGVAGFEKKGKAFLDLVSRMRRDAKRAAGRENLRQLKYARVAQLQTIH